MKIKMVAVHLPHYKPNKEYESPIHEYRVARGLTLKELVQQTKVSQSDISALANGMKSPLKENGELTVSAKRLCDFFGVEPTELFPRYMCTINRNFKHEIPSYETYSEKLSQSSEDLATLREVRKALKKACLSNLDKRELEVITRTILLNDTLEETGKHLNVTQERVRQILVKALRKLRNPRISGMFKDLYKEM